MRSRPVLFMVAAWLAASAGGADVKSGDASRALVRRYEWIKPKLIAAETDDAALDAAAAEYGVWLDDVSRQDQTLAVGDKIAAAKASLAKAVTNAARNSHRRCVDRGDPLELRTMQRLYRYASRFNLGTVTPLLDSTIEKVARFELIFDSRIVNILAAPGASTRDTLWVRATVPLTYDPARGTLSGSGPLRYVKYWHAEKVAGIQTSIGERHEGSTFRVLSGTLRLERGGNPAPPVNLTIDPGRPKEFTLVTGLGISFVDSTYAWREHWQIFHTREEANPDDGIDDGPWIIRGWTRAGRGGAFAVKRYSGPLQLEPPYPIEQTSLELWYRPAR